MTHVKRKTVMFEKKIKSAKIILYTSSTISTLSCLVTFIYLHNSDLTGCLFLFIAVTALLVNVVSEYLITKTYYKADDRFIVESLLVKRRQVINPNHELGKFPWAKKIIIFLTAWLIFGFFSVLMFI